MANINTLTESPAAGGEALQADHHPKKPAVIFGGGPPEALRVSDPGSERARASGGANPGGSFRTNPRSSDTASRQTVMDGRPSRRTVSQLEEERRRKNHVPCWVAYSRFIVETRWFTILTLALTFYALTGDDIRLLGTDKDADDIFDAFTWICIVVFTLEILLSTFGKDDYFLGFFFLLDVISTATLFLDLQVVRASMLQSDDDDDADKMRSSKSARAGARFARFVRILRLVRIIKLYKAVYDDRQRKLAAERKKAMGPGEDDDWDDIEVAESNSATQETRVGQKFTELTIRHVILLVLAMLLVLPQLTNDVGDQIPRSASFGAEVVFDALNRTLNADAENVNEEEKAYRKNAYEEALLQYTYYHNPYSQMGKSPQSMDFLSFVFWIGVSSINAETLDGPDKVWQVSQNSIDSYANRVATMREEDYLYDLGEIPRKVLDGFANWDQECNKERRSGTLYRRGLSLMALQFPDKGVKKPIKCPDELRYEEITPFFAYRMTKSQREKIQLVFYFDQRPFVRDESMFAIAITFSVMLLLCGAAIAFSLDADQLVLNPVEKMISTVHRIRDRPLDAMKMADEEFKREEAKKARDRNKKKEPLAELKRLVLCSSGNVEEVMETVILEKTIIKIGSLLALGFGEAGASIIEHNMHGADSACVDAMVDGEQVTAIIGVARIRDFSTTTEVLQAKVMTFVNQIAEIVHGVVDEFRGAPNKNNGDVFLLVWRIQDSSGAAQTTVPLDKLADMSILAFTKVISAVHSSRVLEVYRNHPGLQQRLGKDCRVNLSFGLHYGWVIEGAVGSEFKIDASYLSPNVSIAESVERATQIYGVNILIAESLIEICNYEMAAKCRLIDKVLITGSPSPMNLYVMDLDYYALQVEEPFKMRHMGNKQRFLARQHLEQEKNKQSGEDVSVVSLFDDHPEITRMRERYTAEFTHVFNMGYQNYSLGEWDVAQRFLHRTKTMLSSGNFVIEDGPSVALLRFMEHHYQFEAPNNWAQKAYRELGHAALS